MSASYSADDSETASVFITIQVNVETVVIEDGIRYRCAFRLRAPSLRD
jgi:hypothetical protein